MVTPGLELRGYHVCTRDCRWGGGGVGLCWQYALTACMHGCVLIDTCQQRGVGVWVCGGVGVGLGVM